MAENDQVSCDQEGKLFSTSPRAIFKFVSNINHTRDIETLKDQPGKRRKIQLTLAHCIKKQSPKHSKAIHQVL